MGQHSWETNIHSPIRGPDAQDVSLPEPLSGRHYCGELDIRVEGDGRWYYNGMLINRKALVCLFASMLLRHTDGRYWLASPTEMGRINVVDAPLIARKCFVANTRTTQVISLMTNVDQILSLGKSIPLVLRGDPSTPNRSLCAIMEGGVEVLLSQPVSDQLMELSEEAEYDGKRVRGVYSEGVFFPIS